MKRALKTVLRFVSLASLGTLVLLVGFFAKFSGESGEGGSHGLTTKDTPLSLFSVPQAHADFSPIAGGDSDAGQGCSSCDSGDGGGGDGGDGAGSGV